MEKLIPCKRCNIKHPTSTQEMKIYSVLAECDDKLFNEGATEPFMYVTYDQRNLFIDPTCFNCKNKFLKFGILTAYPYPHRKLKFCVPCMSLFRPDAHGLTCSGGRDLAGILNLRHNKKNVKAILILLNHKVLPKDLIRMLKSFLY